MKSFLGQVVDVDNNNQATFTPVDKTQHNAKNSAGRVVHTACLVGRPRDNTLAIVMPVDSRSDDEVAMTVNNADSKAQLNLGDHAIENPINSGIRVIAGETRVFITAGSSTLEILDNGNASLIIDGTPVANFTQSSIDFLLPVNMPAGSKVNNKLIAVEGGTTTGNAATQTITNPGQQ
jgi:hypothetical protein